MPTTDTVRHRLLSPAVGVELEDIQLLTANEAAIDAVWSMLDAHALVVLRGQQLSPAELVELTRRFGEPERFGPTRATPEYPEVCIVTNDARAAAVQAVYWHMDGAQQPEPPGLSLFYAVRTLTEGGETLFVDARRAYESLPAEVRRGIEGRSAVMRNGHVQPLVRVHPRTRRRAVQADFGVTLEIEGLERDEARVLFGALREHVDGHESVYAHKWSLGDLTIWDNAAVLHSATPPPPTDELRLMWRTSTRGQPVIPG